MNIKVRPWCNNLLRGSLVCAVLNLYVSGYSQPSGDSCTEERSCKLERKADWLIENEAGGLVKAAFLLTDAVWHKSSLRADQKLRYCIELLRPQKTLAELRGPVNVIAVSPDGEWLAAGSDTNSIALFRIPKFNIANISNWEAKKALPVNGNVFALAFSPDSKYLAAASGRSAATFDVATQTQLAKVSSNQLVRNISFSPDGLRLASAGDDGVALIFNTLDGKDVVRFSPPHPTHVTGLQFSRDGKLLVTASSDGEIRIFAARGQATPINLKAGDAIRQLAMSPDGNWLAAAVDGHKIVSWKMGTNTPITDFIGRTSASAIAFDLDSRWIAGAMEDGSFRVLKQETRENLFGDRNLRGKIYQILFSPDRRWLAIACEDYTARIYDAATGAESGRIAHRSVVKSLAFTQDSSFLISGDADGILAVSPVLSVTEQFRYRDSDASTVAVNPIKKLVAVTTYSHGISLFTLAPEPKRSILHGAHDMVVANFSDNGDFLVSADEHFHVSVFDLTVPEEKDRENALNAVVRQDVVNTAVFSHDAQLFALADDSGTIQVYWAQLQGDEFKPIKYLRRATVLAFSRDSHRLAMGSIDGSVHIYERQSLTGAERWNEQPMRRLTTSGSVTALTFNPEASLIAYGSSEGLLKICDVANGLNCKEHNYGDRIVALVFMMDGTKLAVALGNGLIHVIRPENADKGDEIGLIENHERGIKAISLDENDKWLWTVSMDNSDDLISRFVAVRRFPLDSHELVQQSCEILKTFVEERTWIQVALDEPEHDFCK